MDKSEVNNVEPIKQLLPGDVLDVVRTLRRLRTMLDTTGFTLFAGFEAVGGAEVEAAAARTRASVEQAATDMHELLTLIQKTPNYERMRREALQHIKAAKAASGVRDEDNDE